MSMSWVLPDLTKKKINRFPGHSSSDQLEGNIWEIVPDGGLHKFVRASYFTQVEKRDYHVCRLSSSLWPHWILRPAGHGPSTLLSLWPTSADELWLSLSPLFALAFSLYGHHGHASQCTLHGTSSSCSWSNVLDTKCFSGLFQKDQISLIPGTW